MPGRGWMIFGTPGGGGPGVINPTGPAPDVTAFTAGTIQADGTFAPNMRWDPISGKLLFDWGCILPASTINWTAVQIYLKAPDGQGGFQVIDTGAIARRADFAKNAGVFVHYGTVGIEGPNIPTVPESWSVIGASYNFSGAVNVDGSGNPTGPSVALMTLPPTTATSQPPPQPGDSEWVLSIQSLGYDDYTGTPLATLQAVVNVNYSGVKYYSVLQYIGDTAPTDISLYQDIGVNQEQAASGSTTLAWNVTRPPPKSVRNPRLNGLPITQWYKCIASSSTYTATVANAGNPQSVVLLNVNTAAQVTGFTVSVRSGLNGGVVSGKLRYDFVAPNDPEFYQTIIDRRETDASFTPLASPAGDWANVANTDIPLEQKDWWVWIDGASFWQFRAQSETRVKLINTKNPPTFNLAMPKSGGLNMSGVDPTSLLGTEFQILPTGQLALKGLDLTKAFNFDAATFTNAAGGAFKLNVNASDFDSSSGQLRIKNLSWSKIGVGYDTSDFQIVNEQIIIKNVNWAKSINTFVGNGGSAMPAKISVYNHTGAIIGWIGDDVLGSGYDGAWFKRIAIGGVSPISAQMYADASGNAVFQGTLGAAVGYFGAVGAGQIQTGTLSVGGGVNKPGKIVVYDRFGTANGWIGDDSGSSGYDGAWFKRLAIGGTNPLNAQITADAAGNVSFTGGVWASTLSLTKLGTTTTIDSVSDGSYFVGVRCRENASGLFTTVSPGRFNAYVSTGVSVASLGQTGNSTGHISVSNTSDSSSIAMDGLVGSPRILLSSAGGNRLDLQPALVSINFNTVIDANRYFTGVGVKLNGITDSILNTNVFVGSGANMNGACGATSYNITNTSVPAQFVAGGITNQIRVAVTTSTGFYWCGLNDATGWYNFLNFRGGIFTGITP